MKEIIKTNLLFAFILFTMNGYSQNSTPLVIPLKTAVDKDGITNNVLMGMIDDLNISYDRTLQFTGIPNSIKDKVIMQIDFQPAQHYFEYYVANPDYSLEGLMSAIRYYKADTLQLSRKPIKHVVYLVSGVDHSGNKVLIVDANNNHDFSDDKLMVYDSAFLRKGNQASRTLLPNITVNFQYASQKQVYDRTCNLQVSPVSNMITSDTVFEKFKVQVITNEIKQGAFVVGKSNYSCDVFTRNKPGVIFDSVSAVVDIIEKNEKGIEIGKARHIIGDTVSINNNRYLLSGVSVFGDSLKFSYVGSGTATYGIDTGMVAYNIEAVDFDGNEFNLQKCRGKFVLIDFWGSWCTPCIRSIPDLVAIANKYKGDIQLVSVAVDVLGNMPALKKIINDQQMNWIHVFQSRNDLDKKTIVNKYQVVFYPTQILIDPDGKIICREVGAGKGGYMNSVLRAAIAKRNKAAM
ncbi:TlpA disulfide reductase family protein [Chitinophagaceae bacterium 26-R-25]|nr:TlpA disulfide reductase family protein [Chitinophagaceae bacterium 26-R-25]